MRKITDLRANDDWTLYVAFDDGVERSYDVKPLLGCEAFRGLSDISIFKKVRNGGYYIEWETEADLSADTLYLEGVPK